MKKTDLDFKDTHDKNGIPICCMTCAKWSFSGGKTCGLKGEIKTPCKIWEVSKYYKGGKNEHIISEADGESQAR